MSAKFRAAVAFGIVVVASTTLSAVTHAGVITTLAPDGAGGVRLTIDAVGTTNGACDPRVCVTVPDRVFLKGLNGSPFLQGFTGIEEEARILATPIDNASGVMLVGVRLDSSAVDSPWADDFDLNFSGPDFFLPDAGSLLSG